MEVLNVKAEAKQKTAVLAITLAGYPPSYPTLANLLAYHAQLPRL